MDLHSPAWKYPGRAPPHNFGATTFGTSFDELFLRSAEVKFIPSRNSAAKWRHWASSPSPSRRAFLVEDRKVRRAKCTRYIHLNPARVPGLDDAPVETRREAIRQCRWSSLGAVLGLRRRPDWLGRDAVLRDWGETVAERRAAYARFVDGGLGDDIADPLEAAVAGTLIGGERVIDRMRRALTELSENVNVRRESGQHRQLASWRALERVVVAVARAYGCCEQAELLRRYNRGCEARQVLLYLAATHCRSRYSLSELGLQVGPVTVSTIGAARQRVAARAAEDPELRQRIDAISAIL